jgi:hypothetical protein
MKRNYILNDLSIIGKMIISIIILAAIIVAAVYAIINSL